MVEKILEIVEFEARNEGGCGTVAGFKVVTDVQTLTLSIDNEPSCCENWGYFWCNENTQDFLGANLLSVKVTDSALSEAIMLSYNLNPNDKWFQGGVMFVNLETDRGTLQFITFNEHNGAYGHAAKIQCAQLNHTEIL